MTEHRLSLTALAEALKNGAHSIFSASGSAMSLGCSGSLIPNILAPDSGSLEAAEGTVAHSVGEVWLRSGKKPRHLLNTTEVVPAKPEPFKIEITHEMLDQVQRYVDWCWSQEGTHYIEQRVDYSQITPIPNQGGTLDHAACWWEHLVITDLKYGKGVQVFAEKNPQLMLYALGFFYEWDWLYNFRFIKLRVAQPRLDHFDEYDVTREELLEFAEYARARWVLAWQLDAPRTPGEKQCQWCKVKPSCAAFAAFQDSIMAGIFPDLTQPIEADRIAHVKEDIDWMVPFKKFRPLAELDTTQMSVLYQYKGMMESWWKALDAELRLRAAKGEKTPLQKLVEGRSKRKYRDEAKAIRYFVEDLELPREQVVIQTLHSPMQMEKILRKNGYSANELANLLAEVVYKPHGKPSLVSISDKRPAISEISDAVFRDLTNPEDPETED